MIDGSIPEGRWTTGPSIDGRGTFRGEVSKPLSQKPSLAPARPDSGAQAGQTSRSSMTGIIGAVEGAVERNV